MKNRIDYFTSTRDFVVNSNKKGYYYWKKFAKYFKEGNQILVRNSKTKIDYLIKLVEDPEIIPTKYSKYKWYNQKYRAKFEVIEEEICPTGKSRQLLIREKNDLLKNYNYKCPGLSFKSSFTSKLIEINCTTQFNNTVKPQYDHIIDFSSKGGLTILNNLQPLCEGCHKVKTALTRRELILLLESKFRRT
ncbi:MAG: HNH endonuclease [Candidatus Tenebribacter davisii]|nr:HNH endonuclease [Candidatus Tenebribacter davisii]